MKLVVYLGTGGVGKTSVAAATALAQARAGVKSLVLTIDPSLRLRTTLRLADGSLEQQVPLEPPCAGELWGALLDVRTTLDEAVRLYGDPAKVERILHHPIYATIADSLAGMAELMAIERIDQLARRGFEHIVVDTAPSRHALEFLDKPVFFAHLTDSRWVKLAGRGYRVAQATGMVSLGRRTLKLYQTVESILGTDMVRQVLDFYALFFSIAEGYAARAKKTLALLRDPAVTEFRIVTTPHKALPDAGHFLSALEARHFRLGAVYVNRLWENGASRFPDHPLAARVLDWYASVHASQLAALDRLKAEHGYRIRRIACIPELERDVDGLAALERIAARLQQSATA